MFGIFGAVLSITGGSQTFIRIAQKLTGKATGGPGKVALIASGLFGMISGSAMANVVAT
ncbi:MAG: TRAP transporter large permease subunit [Clostridium sp.]